MVKVIQQLTLILLISTSTVSAVTWTYTENTSGNNLLPLGYPVPMPVNSLTPVDGFRTYSSLFARHQDLMLGSNNITGTIVGNTIDGRDIWAYSLSDADNTTVEGMVLEGAVLQNGGIHAREWSTPEVTTGIMERLAANEADQWLYQYLLENVNIVIQPVENVDGFLQTQRFPNQVLKSTSSQDGPTTPRDGRMRRKNMRDVDEDLETTADGMFGIDLNRNNAPFWNTSNRSSPATHSIVHHGSGAASEPETQALKAAGELGPTNRLRMYIDTHSFSQLWYVPNTNNSRRNTIAIEVANAMRDATSNQYTFETSPANSGIGSTDEYFANTYQIPSYTLETEPTANNGSVQYGGNGVSHSGFILPEAEITRVREQLTDASIIAWYMQSGPAALIAVEIRDTDTDTIVYAGTWDATSASNRNWNETVNTGLAANGNYRIWAAYNKPMRWLDGQQQVSNFTGTNISLPPTVSIEGLDANATAFNQTINGVAADWLTNPGGAGQGYLNYKTDAFMIDFSVDNSIDPASSTLVALAFNNQDIVGKINDADPTTVVDWNSNWQNYENSQGTQADNGGIDRTLRIIDDGSPAFTDPANNGNGGGNGGNGGGNGGGTGGGGGGGSIGWLLVFMLSARLLMRKS